LIIFWGVDVDKIQPFWIDCAQLGCGNNWCLNIIPYKRRPKPSAMEPLLQAWQRTSDTQRGAALTDPAKMAQQYRRHRERRISTESMLSSKPRIARIHETHLTGGLNPLNHSSNRSLEKQLVAQDADRQ